MQFLNEKGFSLTSTMVATGLVGVLALGIMRITEQGYKGSSDLTARQEIRDLRDEFYVAMRSNSCGLLDPDPEKQETFQKKGWKFEGKKMGFSKIFGRWGEFKPGAQYGNLKIAKNNPFSIGPIGRNSPFLKDFSEDKKKGDGYFEISTSDTVSEYAAQLTILLTKPISAGKGRNGEGVEVPIHFLVILEVNKDNIIVGCKTISQISAAKEACLSLNAGEVMEFDWNNETNKCDVEVRLKQDASDGKLPTNDPGNIDPKIYILDQIPG